MKCIRATTIAVFAMLLQAAAPSDASAQQRADSLRPLTRCDFVDGLRVVASDRTPAEIHERQVMTALGVQRVSLADGYRVMLTYPTSDFFVNMKVERSEDSRYSNDKNAIVANMVYLANQSSKEARAVVPLEHKTSRGLDMYSFDFPTIDFFIANNPPTLGGGPIGTYVLFDDARRLIVTVYFLNQSSERRPFRTIAEYRVLRDRFLERYVACLTAN